MPKYSGFDPEQSHNVVRTSTTTGSSNHDADPVSLYLPFDSDVQDASANNHTVTAYGDAAISSAQSKFGGNSLAVDGNGDYLSIPDSNSFNFGNDDFTIECFIRPDSINTSGMTSSVATFVDHDSNAGTTGAWFSFSQQNATLLWSVNNGTLITTSSCLSAATWHHVVAVRAGNTTTIYCDGINVGSASDTQNYTDSSSRVLYIGKQNSNTRLFTGYIDDLRISKGVARYTKNFVPPSQAVGATLNGTNETNTTSGFTSLYLPFDSDTNDDSSHTHTVAVYGNAAISSTQAKFGSNSLSLDGTGDYLQIADNAAFEFGDGDLTIEAWLYQNDDTGHVLTCKRATDGSWNSGAWLFGINTNVAGSNDDAGNVEFWAYDYNSGSPLLEFDNGSALSSGWHHFAVTRIGDLWILFVDGAQVDTQDWTGSIGDASHPVFIGKDSYSGGRYETNGYIDDFRILKGYAKYTADFSPPTSAVGTSVSETVNDLTVLYMPFDDDSFENQARNHGVTKNGNATLNTSVKKFGTSSLYLDGTGDYVLIDDDGDFNLGNDDFTIECWAYIVSGTGRIIHGGATADYVPFLFRTFGGGSPYISFYSSSTGSSWGDFAGGVSLGDRTLNTWLHLAVTREGNTFRCFQNGTLTSTTTSTGSLMDVEGGAITLGRYPDGTDYFNGYIDDLRIIKGKAVYTEAFTAPSSAHGTELSETTTSQSTDTKALSSTWTMTDDGSSPRSFVNMRLDNTWANNEHLQIQPGHRWYSAPAGPSGTSVTFKAWGAGGAGGYWNGNSSGSGGSGGFAKGTLSATPGTTYNVVVGSNGTVGGGGNSAPEGGKGAGVNNGGHQGGAGGGFSGVFEGPISIGNAIIVAGGGGGAGSYDRSGEDESGGGGGGPTGADAANPGPAIGKGGTQSAGGYPYGGGGAGAALQGGAGRDRFSMGAGGGGGGYYGGSGGGADGSADNEEISGGGGGSGYVSPALTDTANLQGVTGTAGTNATEGQKTAINPTASSDPSYTGTYGQGGRFNTNGNPGYVVITSPSGSSTFTSPGTYTVP